MTTDFLCVDSERLYNVEEGTPVWIGASLPTDYGE